MGCDGRYQRQGLDVRHPRRAARHGRPQPRAHYQPRLDGRDLPYPGGNVYGATKAFVQQFSLNLRADLFGTKVRVTDVKPGLVGGTEFSTVRFGGDEAKAAKLYEGADALTPEDIAETIHWIATLPPRVNINAIELMPVTQAFGPLPVHRDDRPT
jgi:3-hydroxy acid dehydrogenase / malonic semialdehyde reductase